MTRILSAISTGIHHFRERLGCEYFGDTFPERLSHAIRSFPGDIRWGWVHCYDHGCI